MEPNTEDRTVSGPVRARPLRAQTVRGRRKQIVLTIHGVNPNRRWQPNIHKVLAPFFTCRAHRYHEYDTWRGPIRAIVSIPLFLAGLLVVALGIYALSAWPLAGAAGSVAGFACIVVSFVAARRKRRRCADRLKVEIGQKCGLQRPHVIAHSLGTYLIGRVIEKFDDINLANVVLVSAVLPQKYPWAENLRRNPDCVQGVRSEFGKADWVVRAVGWMHWLVRDLGNAGRYGFRAQPNFVHTGRGLTRPCLTCIERLVPVHNFPLGQFEHSTHFLGTLHARKIWLPYLWGLPIIEFLRFLKASDEATRLEADKRYAEADAIIDRLWRRRFAWCDGRSLGEYAEAQIDANIARRRGFPADVARAEILDEVRNHVHAVVVDADAEAMRSDNVDEEIARLLDPRLAVAEAVDAIVAEIEKHHGRAGRS
jgi:pimeloyl-ACP methyl ester carboxylesterase